MRQNTIRKMIGRNVERQLVREYLLKETERAGFGGLHFNRTPEGTKVTLSAEQVGRVIGRRGKVIHELQRRLQEDFKLTNPQLEVEEIEDSRINAQVMASRLASSLADNRELVSTPAGTWGHTWKPFWQWSRLVLPPSRSQHGSERHGRWRKGMHRHPQRQDNGR